MCFASRRLHCFIGGRRSWMNVVIGFCKFIGQQTFHIKIVPNILKERRTYAYGTARIR